MIKVLKSNEIRAVNWISCSRQLSRLWVRHNHHHPEHHQVKMYSSSYELKQLLITDVNGQESMVSYIDEDHSNASSSSKPPLVILGGTAQTINTFTPHIQGLRRDRRLVIIEMRGQGKTELDSSYCNMPQLLKDLKVILQKLNITNNMHLCGFSFGGRVAVTFAAHHPKLVSKLSITGVPLCRPPLGKLIIQSWEDALSRGNIRECAWSFVLNGYSNDFINRNHNKLHNFMDFVMKANKVTNLYNLIKFSHQDYGSEYNFERCASLIKCPTQIIAATEDRIAGYMETLELAKVIHKNQTLTMETGHLAPFENAAFWRSNVLKFFDSHHHT